MSVIATSEAFEACGALPAPVHFITYSVLAPDLHADIWRPGASCLPPIRAEKQLDLIWSRPLEWYLWFSVRHVIGVLMTTTVLIVDDSKLARIVAAKAITALQPEWHRVEASNADEALRLISQRQIDIVLVDFNMPGKNGVELAGELRRARPSMPIALITANIQNEVIASAKAVNVRFVTKPVTQEGLQAFLADAAQALKTESK